MLQVELEKREREGRTWPEEEEREFRREMQAKYDNEASASFATARLWDDGVIDPADTRRVLGLAFGAAANAGGHTDTQFGVFRM